ncbi:DUF4259 domain-containing protein [Ferrimonas senticii]|uniref:DUF4259 domain-containing protein n=1 Tax=Ferrimonas senticii TaxID=394566 RepID=UPI0003F9810A|nr:DUF4259 domain-containing protein [Ferrimonas senticii]
MAIHCPTFDNPISATWLEELVGSRGIGRLMAPHNNLLEQSDTPNLRQCWQAVASAEVVAAGYSKNHAYLPSAARHWLNRRQGRYSRRCKITATQVNLARNSLKRAMAAPSMRDWCAAHPDDNRWQQQLLQRLSI